MNLSDVCLPVFRHMLGNLRHCLDKAAADVQARNYDPSVLIGYRLAPDMLPFKAQVFIACDAAKLCCVRVGGVEAPVFEDKADTLDELKARIDATLAWLATVDPAVIDRAEDSDVTFKAGPATRTMKGADYVRLYALPNMFFHISTAYAILRHNGVSLGKRDYLMGSAT